MVYIADVTTTAVMGLSEFSQYVEDNVDLRDFSSLCECAPALRALANERRFVLDDYHTELKKYWTSEPRSIVQAQSITNHRGPGFYVRTNAWPSFSAFKENSQRHERGIYGFDLPHDHDFRFLTVGYYGPGYTTDLYEYDPPSGSGVRGEKLVLKSLGQEKLSPGRIMAYRERSDVHTQNPPDSLSISVNLICEPKQFASGQQYIFDIEQGEITRGAGCKTTARLAIVNVLGTMHDEESVELLATYATSHWCKRTQAYSLKMLDKVNSYEAERVKTKVDAEVRRMSERDLVI